MKNMSHVFRKYKTFSPQTLLNNILERFFGIALEIGAVVREKFGLRQCPC